MRMGFLADRITGPGRERLETAIDLPTFGLPAISLWLPEKLGYI